jgi:hypothetical protein
MHDRKDLYGIWLRPIDNSIGEAGEFALVDVAIDRRVHLRAPEYSMEGIFKNIEKPLLKAWLSFPVKSCRFASLRLSTRMPPDLD